MNEHETPETPQSNDPAPRGDGRHDAFSGPSDTEFVLGGHRLPGGGPQSTVVQSDREVDADRVSGVEGSSRKRLSRGVLIGIVAGAVVVLLGVAAAIVVPLVVAGGRGSSAAEAETPAAFVEGYLRAVAAGDADAALEFIEVTADVYDAGLLTDEVLASSLELGPIENIEIGKEQQSERGTTVEAAFTVGGEEVARTFEVYMSAGDDGMTILDGVSRIPVSTFEGLGLTVNGVAAEESASLFPGTYEFAVTEEGVFIDGEDTFLVADHEDELALYDIQVALDEERVEEFRAMVIASLKECVAMKTLTTPCGLDVEPTTTDGFTVVDGSITRTLTVEGESDLRALEPHVSTRAVVTAYLGNVTDVTFEASNGTLRGLFEISWGAHLKTPKVDFAADDPKVVWE